MRKVWVKVGLTEAQRGVLDALVKDGRLGGSRSEVLASLLVRQVNLGEQASVATEPQRTVVLARGEKGINVIKVIREFTGMGLADAKRASEIPTPMYPLPERGSVEAFRKILRDLGASIEAVV